MVDPPAPLRGLATPSHPAIAMGPGLRKRMSAGAPNAAHARVANNEDIRDFLGDTAAGLVVPVLGASDAECIAFWALVEQHARGFDAVMSVVEDDGARERFSRSYRENGDSPTIEMAITGELTPCQVPRVDDRLSALNAEAVRVVSVTDKYLAGMACPAEMCPDDCVSLRTTFHLFWGAMGHVLRQEGDVSFVHLQAMASGLDAELGMAVTPEGVDLGLWGALFFRLESRVDKMCYTVLEAAAVARKAAVIHTLTEQSAVKVGRHGDTWTGLHENNIMHPDNLGALRTARKFCRDVRTVDLEPLTARIFAGQVRSETAVVVLDAYKVGSLDRPFAVLGARYNVSKSLWKVDFSDALYCLPVAPLSPTGDEPEADDASWFPNASMSFRTPDGWLDDKAMGVGWLPATANNSGKAMLAFLRECTFTVREHYEAGVPLLPLGHRLDYAALALPSVPAL